MQEDINGRDDVQRRTLLKGGMTQEDIIEGRDEAGGGHYRRER